MANIIQRIKTKTTTIIHLFFLFFIAASVQSATFTSVSNGDWNSSSTWDSNGVPDVNNWPNDKVIINHAVTKSGGVTMNGSASRITINNGGSLTLTGTLDVGSGELHVNSGGVLSANIIYLNTSSTCGLNGTITSTSTMHLDGHFSGSPTLIVGGNLLVGAQNKNQLFTALNMQVTGDMTVQNAKLTWTTGTVTVGGNFELKGTGDVDVPNGGSLDISGTLAINNLLTIDGPSGPGSGGIVSWGVGNVVLSGNNTGLNSCPLPYSSPFDLSTCSQDVGSNQTALLVTISENPGQQWSTLSGVDVFSFDSMANGNYSNVNWSGVGTFDDMIVHQGGTVFGAVDTLSQWGVNSQQMTVGNLVADGWGTEVQTTTLTLDNNSSYFGLYWSAGDGNDLLQFYNGENLVAEFTTETIVNSASLTSQYYGDPYQGTNPIEPYAFVNFYGDANTTWNKIIFSQTSYESGFEVDNLTSRISTFDYAIDDINEVGNIVAEVSGTTTTASDNETSTWDFGSANVAENCANGIDDDNDGLIDCGDTDCYGDNGCEDCESDYKENGGGFSTRISSLEENGDGSYTIQIEVSHNGCSGPSCKELSHFSVEVDNTNSFSNVSWSSVSGVISGNIELSLGNNDPFDGFKLDNVSGIGDGNAGSFTITYTLDNLQEQDFLAKAGNNYTQIATFPTTEFFEVLNCSGGTNDDDSTSDDSCSSCSATENCSNGIDDDNDGLIDCGDTDCYGDNDCEDAFECTSTLYQVISKTLKELNITTSSYDDIGVAAELYNGGGFNYQDGYIYGIYNNSASNRKLWRIDNQGQESDLGKINDFGGISYAGDFDQEGKLYTYKSGSYPVLYYVDVDNLPLVHVAQNLTNLHGSSIPGAADITYNPVTNKFYGLASNRKIIIIDPILLTVDVDVTLVNEVSTSGAFGATYSDREGNSYFSNNNDGRIFKLTLDNTGNPSDLIHVGNGEPTSQNDGMACSNSLPPFETDCGDGIDNDGDGLIDCNDPDCFIDSACPRLTAELECMEESGPNGIIPFHLRLINESQADAIDFSISEVLPFGFSMLYDTITFSSGAYQADSLNHPSFGATDTIQWATLNIPVGDTLEISYSVLVDENVTEGIYSNYVSPHGVLMNPNIISHDILISNFVIDQKQTLSCKPAFYQVYKKRGEPNIYAKLNVETGDYAEIAPISHQANGLGFDYATGLAYGAEGRLFISIDSSGIVENLGSFFNRKVYVGDTDTLGNWWGKDVGDMVKINIETKSFTRYENAGMPGWDMAYNKDGNFYAVHNTTLYKFNPHTQVKSTLGNLLGDAVPNSGHGAQWTGSDGRLYISNNRTGKIYRVDVETREAKLMMQSTAGLRFNDGFSCPIELPAPLTFDHHDYSLFPAASIFTYSQNIDGIPQLEAVWAGSGVDYETESLAYTTADSDSYDDGLTYTSYLPEGTISTWQVNLNTNFTSKEVFYGLWIDWDVDNSIDSFYNGSKVITGADNVPVAVNVPSDFVDTVVAVRLIVSERVINEGDIDLYEDDITGEVEDYTFYGNTLVDCENGLDDDNDGLVDCDDPDCYENCKYTTTKSGNDGGLESNNRLSHKVNLVNYNKKLGKYGRQARRSNQKKINKDDFKRSLQKLNKSNASIESYMPIDVIPNTESRVSSPEHLIKITNATELYSIDIYEGVDRKGAVLGLESSNGVYEHTKYVCDRLAGSKILDILTYEMDLVENGRNPDTFKVNLIIPKMELEEGLVEYAVSFSVRDTVDSNVDKFVFESHWNLDDYTKNEGYLNFQIWASNVRDLEILVDDIFKSLTDTRAFGKPISKFKLGNAPVFYVNTAKYSNGNLELEITNKSNLSSVNLAGLVSYTETTSTENINAVLNLNGQESETVTYAIGRLYDMGITFYHPSLNAHDIIFLADGAWNYSKDPSDPVSNVASFNSFVGSNFNPDNYEMDRNITMSGQVRDYVNVFRSFNPNFTKVNVDSFDNLNFTISGTGSVELAVLKESVNDYISQGKYYFDLTEEATTYSLCKKHFTNESGISQDWSDLFMVQFTLIGDGVNTQQFNLNISDLYWGPNQLEEDFMVFSETGVIKEIDNNHTANIADGTDLGDVILNADFSGDSLLISIDNIGDADLSIEDAFIDALLNHFELLDFEPKLISAGETYTMTLRYDPQETPLKSDADLRITINGDDSYVISLRGSSICSDIDHVKTNAIKKSDKVYKATEMISSDAIIDHKNISFIAGQTVVLELGFEVTANSSMQVMIEDACSMDD